MFQSVYAIVSNVFLVNTPLYLCWIYQCIQYPLYVRYTGCYGQLCTKVDTMLGHNELEEGLGLRMTIRADAVKSTRRLCRYKVELAKLAHPRVKPFLLGIHLTALFLRSQQARIETTRRKCTTNQMRLARSIIASSVISGCWFCSIQRITLIKNPPRFHGFIHSSTGLRMKSMIIMVVYLIPQKLYDTWGSSVLVSNETFQRGSTHDRHLGSQFTLLDMGPSRLKPTFAYLSFSLCPSK